MGRRGPRPKGSRTSTLQPAVAPRLVGGEAEAARLVEARRRVPGEGGKEFFDSVTREFAKWSAPELELLVRAAQAVARVEEARARVEEDGILVDGARGGLVRHPALLVERAALSDLRAALKDLKLDEAQKW